MLPTSVESAEMTEPRPLKYATEIGGIPSCPPTPCVATRRSAVRFIHKDRSDSRNFLPPAKINPARSFPNGAKRCSAFALSFFETKERAFAFLLEIEKRFPNIRKSIGDVLVSGTIAPEDGLATPPDAKGHFDLHERVGATLELSFSVEVGT